MQTVHKFMHAESGLEPSTWFEHPSEIVHTMRSGTDPLNIKTKMGRLEIRRQFFSVRVTSVLKKTPADINRRKGSASFKERINAYERTQCTLPNT